MIQNWGDVNRIVVQEGASPRLLGGKKEKVHAKKDPTILALEGRRIGPPYTGK